MNLFDTIGQKFKDDPDLKDRLTIGLQGLTMNPNQGLVDLAKGNIAQRQKQTMMSQQANKTIEFLRAKGVDEATLKSLEGNPQMLMAYASQLMKSQLSSPTEQPSKVREFQFAKNQGYQGSYEQFLQLGKGDSVTGGINVDPATGQQYIVRGGERVDIPNATQLTPGERSQLGIDEKLLISDIQRARDKGFEMFTRAETVNSAIGNLQKARNLVAEQGAESGVIRNLLPAFDSATSQLRSIVNTLGINTISLVTFGALSEKELQLALTTQIDTTLKGDELVKNLDERIAAQEKLRNWLDTQAKTLTRGNIPMTQYIQQFQREGDDTGSSGKKQTSVNAYY